MLIVHTLKSQNTINLKFRSYRIKRSCYSLRSSLKVIANSLGWNDNEKAGTSIEELLLLYLLYESLFCYVMPGSLSDDDRIMNI